VATHLAVKTIPLVIRQFPAKLLLDFPNCCPELSILVLIAQRE
jgi:hypothetical protein